MLLLLLGLTGLAFLYVMLVPPRAAPRRTRPKTTALPAQENAWTEYAQALADLGREPAPAWLREATTSPELTTSQLAYLARHLEAMAHLRAGSARARFEYFEEAPTVAGMLQRGWAITAGERWRQRTGPAVRITISTL